MQSFEDNTYHEDDEKPGSECVLVSSLLGLDWSTSQSLKLGENDYTPALLLYCAGGQVLLAAFCPPFRC